MGKFFGSKDEGRMSVYSVFDIKAQGYLTPFFSKNDGTAYREFEQVVNDDRSFLKKNPEDYSLFKIGTFDDLNGVLFPETPRSICTAVSVLRQLLPGDFKA